MERKIDTLRAMMREGLWHDAIRFAAKFPRLGNEKVAITRAKDCIVNPRFYESMGRNIEEEIHLGIIALNNRFKI